jgi:hypothetical protein
VESEEAKELAYRYLANKPWWSDEKYAIVHVERMSQTWVVVYNSRMYAQTGEARHGLAGNGPILVNEDGRIFGAATARPIEDYVTEFESNSTQG